MINLRLSRHADSRLQQRGMRIADLELLEQHGTLMTDGRLIMTDADIARETAAMKRLIARFERLRGLTAIIADNLVLTVYRQRRLRRRGS